MEGTFPRSNAHLIITIKFSSSNKKRPTLKKIIINTTPTNNKNEELKIKKDEVLNDSIIKYPRDYISELFGELFFLIYANNISMLKRSHSMDFDSDHYKSTEGETENENKQIKKLCNSPERSNLDDKSQSTDRDGSPDNNRSYRRLLGGESGAHVTQSKSIFSHEDSIVYGNPKDELKNIENPSTSEASREMSPFDNNSISVLDLSCKGKTEEEKAASGSPGQTDGNTYQNYQKSNYDASSFNRSNLEIKLVPPKKPSLPEQLQIAKLQQQQRRSIQQQQKMLQQMRKSLDSTKPAGNRTHHTNNVEKKHSTPNHEQNDLDNLARMKEEYHPPSIPGAHFPPPQYPYFDPAHMKELPDGHPILPLLDPVYFSALYNAHGFLPPSSPSIAAAFIGTLQDALPKLPMMFPSTSSYNSSLLPQKSNENQN